MGWAVPVSAFDGHIKLLILNSPNNPELPDRTVAGRARTGPAQQALQSSGSTTRDLSVEYARNLCVAGFC